MSSAETDVQMPCEVSEPVRSVLDLFRGPLNEVVFPDASAERLEALLDGVRERCAQVATARIALEGAQHELDAALTELTGCARRSHAYASVFAQGDEALSAELAAIDIQPKPERRRKKAEPKVKKRRRAAQADGLELPLPGDANTADSSEADLH